MKKSYVNAFNLFSDQPSAENSAQPLDQPSESNPIDPSTYTDAPAKALVYDSPPTAADQEEPPESITNEMSKESGATMDSDDYLWSRNRNWHQSEQGKPKEGSFNRN